LNGLRQSGGRDDVGTADKQQTDDAFSGGILRPHLRQNVADLRIRLRNFVTQTASAVLRDFGVDSDTTTTKKQNQPPEMYRTADKRKICN